MEWIIILPWGIILVWLVIHFIFKLQKKNLERRYKPEDDKSRRGTINGDSTIPSPISPRTEQSKRREYIPLPTLSGNSEIESRIKGLEPKPERTDKIAKFLQGLKE